jgi:hypothetical protein
MVLKMVQCPGVAEPLTGDFLGVAISNTIVPLDQPGEDDVIDGLGALGGMPR